jgi:prepilin-type N-terminal cleavage/methylation domain-containing protein
VSLKDGHGMTLIEVLVAIAIMAIIATLSASAMRHYWMVHALEGSTDEVMTQLRGAQGATTSESHPVIFGVKFREESSAWDVVRYDPEPEAGSPNCTVTRRSDMTGGNFDATVVVSSANFTVTDPPQPWLSACRADLGVPDTDDFVFFYARGSATGGSVTFLQPTLNREETVTVQGVTGRVKRT